jgi:hypothetical protein
MKHTLPPVTKMTKEKLSLKSPDTRLTDINALSKLTLRLKYLDFTNFIRFGRPVLAMDFEEPIIESPLCCSM